MCDTTIIVLATWEDETSLLIWRGRSVELPTSKYASPCFAVPNPNDKHRLVVDYRRLNQKVKFESIPIPDLKTAFSWFGKAKYFSVIDLTQAYHQIGLILKSRP